MKDTKLKTPPARSTDFAKRSKHPDTNKTQTSAPVEVGGPKGPEPTRYGDWEKAGRCSDF